MAKDVEKVLQFRNSASPEKVISVKKDTTACKVLLSESPQLQQMFLILIPYIKIQIKVCNLFNCIPYTWDENNQRISVLKSKWKLRFCKLQVIIHSVYTLIMLGYFLTPGSMKLNKTSTKLLGFVFLSCLLVTMFMRIEFWFKRKEAILLWKAFIDFEEQYIDGKTIELNNLFCKYFYSFMKLAFFFFVSSSKSSEKTKTR